MADIKKVEPKKSNMVSRTTAPMAAEKDLTEGQRQAVREMLESVYATNKWHIVRVNFLRGIAFGLGTFIGGTIVIAIVIWILSRTVDLFPWARDFTQQLIDSLKK